MAEGKWSRSDKLAIALACLGAAVALILFLVEKSPITVGLMTFFIAALLTYPIFHFLPLRKFQIPALIVMFILVFVFGLAVWPKKIQVPQTAQSRIEPRVSSTNNSNPTSNTPAPSRPNIPAKPKSRPKKPETKEAPSVSSSGADSPAIGSITQGPGSALSVNQQGGITAGTVNNFGPLLLPTATVTICATYPDVVAGE